MGRPFKLSKLQAEAVLEMRLRQLTGLDAAELQAEMAELEKTLTSLDELINNSSVRSKWLFKQMTDMAVRHGEARRSQIIDPPDSYVATIQRGEKKVSSVVKPRFLQIDSKKGIVTQVKGPRGAMVVERDEKVILMTEDGTLRKVPSNFKGPISSICSPVVLAKRESEIIERIYLAVFILEGQLKAMALSGADLCKVTSKGKQWLPDGAEFHYLGEGSYVVPWGSSRKKKVELFPLEVRKGRPGAKGQKVANLDDVMVSH